MAPAASEPPAGGVDRGEMPDASLWFCELRGAAGHRGQAAKRRFSSAGPLAALRGYAARVSLAGLRQNPPRLHPYSRASLEELSFYL